MIAVLTGDIVNSRSLDSAVWLPKFKEQLHVFGSTPADWEVFRGDSFQLAIASEQALYAAFMLKATIKQFKDLDIRIAIGLGEQSYKATHVTESNGSAFVNSGECFDDMKPLIAVKSTNQEVDAMMNLLLDVGLLTFNTWKPMSALYMKTALEHPDLSQTALAKLLGKSQGSVSEGLSRAGFDQLQKIITFYKTNYTY